MSGVGFLVVFAWSRLTETEGYFLYIVLVPATLYSLLRLLNISGIALVT